MTEPQLHHERWRQTTSRTIWIRRRTHFQIDKIREKFPATYQDIAEFILFRWSFLAFEPPETKTKNKIRRTIRLRKSVARDCVDYAKGFGISSRMLIARVLDFELSSDLVIDEIARSLKDRHYLTATRGRKWTLESLSS